MKLRRKVGQALGAQHYSGLRIFCGREFYDALVAHEYVKELVLVSQFDAVLQTVTVVSLPAEWRLQRGDSVQSADQQWTVDCKLKDNGQMIWWRLHEA
ncbi:major capsid protein [uncultured Endozoicomonas sp.]|uniref:major capsid protein n=1 Tax=uncultured Endozoicomonas sp. TaxID=432652 RepID=UPI00261BFE3A|nr:major capsid protein [uncultured Endozoicomonas sp.]